MKEKTQIALVQMRCGPEPDTNLAHALELSGVAAKNGAQIVCLPELFRSQYFCQSENHDNFSLAETIPGPSTAALTKLAREKSIVIVASLFEKRAAGVFHNTAVMIDADGNILGKYRKMHIPDDPSYYEKFYFTRAISAFRVGKRHPAISASAFAGTNGIRKRRDSRRCAERKLFSIRRRLAGTQARRKNMVTLNFPPGRRCSAATPSLMVALSPRQIV